MDNFTGKRIFLEHDPITDMYKKLHENTGEIVNSPSSNETIIQQNKEALGQECCPEDDVKSILGDQTVTHPLDGHIDKNHADVVRQLVGSGKFELKGVDLTGPMHRSELLHKDSGKSLYALSATTPEGQVKTDVYGQHEDQLHEYPKEEEPLVTKDATEDGSHPPVHQEPDGDEAPGNPSDGDEDDEKKDKVEESVLEEAEMTPDLKDKQEFYVNKLKKNRSEFEDKYGDKAESVMYATATKLAKNDLGIKE